MKEIWKDIKDFEGLYQVSNLSRIKSLNYNHTKQEKILKKYSPKGWYESISLSKNGKRETFQIHRLVAETFIPNPENKPQVNHKDGNKENNRVDNLEWATNSENQRHAFKTGLQKIRRGKENPVYGRRGKESARRTEVNQYDLKGNFIKSWDCIADIHRELGILASAIVSCCKGNTKTSGGYKWEHKKRSDNKCT